MNVIRTGGFYGIVRVVASFINLFYDRCRFALLNLNVSWQVLAVILTCMNHYGGSA